MPKKKSNLSQPAASKPAVFTRKENSTLKQQIEILDWHYENGKNQSATARHFAPKYPNLKLKQPLVSQWVKEKAKICEQWKEVFHKCGHIAKRV